MSPLNQKLACLGKETIDIEKDLRIPAYTLARSLEFIHFITPTLLKYYPKQNKKVRKPTR